MTRIYGFITPGKGRAKAEKIAPSFDHWQKVGLIFHMQSSSFINGTVLKGKWKREEKLSTKTLHV